MKHDLQRPFYTLFISVPSTYFSFTVCGKGGKKWFLIESGQPNEKMGVQDITNQGNGTGQAKTDVLKSAIRFGLNLMKSQHSPLQNKKTKTKKKRTKKSQSNTHVGQVLDNKTEWQCTTLPTHY